MVIWMAIVLTFWVMSAPMVSFAVVPCTQMDTTKTEVEKAGEGIFVTGQVSYIDLEGGFWGIIGDDSKRYEVINLPGEFRKQGLRVSFHGKVRSDRVSIHMWGVVVEVISPAEFCPHRPVINCMPPFPEESRIMCGTEYLKWVKENCPGIKIIH